MYNNFQQRPVYESTGSYTQPIYSTQYSQIPFANNTFMNQPSQSIYESAPSQPPAYPISTGPQYGNNTYMSQQSQPIYQPAPQQSQPMYQPAPQQPRPIYQPSPQQPQPIYQPVPQQPPPPYATAVQSKPYSTYGQQQQQQQQPQNNPRPSASPPSTNYQWPHKSVATVCPKCGASVTTRVETKVTPITLIAAAILLCFSCILVCLPFCIPACKRVTHYCPYCKSAIGVRRELT